MTPDRLRVGLVGCGARKLPHAAPARHLYTGPLFTDAARHAEATCDAWYILSAKHGCVPPDQVLAPYDARMRDHTVDRRTIWVNRVDTRFRLDEGYGLWSEAGGQLTVVFFAGADYRDPLVARWNRLPWDLEAPLAGLGIGKQRAWYKAHR